MRSDGRDLKRRAHHKLGEAIGVLVGGAAGRLVETEVILTDHLWVTVYLVPFGVSYLERYRVVRRPP